MQALYYDLHIHSCLSPCAAEDMTPANIAGMAKVAGLDLVAVADHNSTGNCRSFLAAAEKWDLIALPAMELCTAEEMHVLCLFGAPEDAERFGDYVYAHLPELKNRPDIFGTQYLMDADETVLGEEPRLLANAAQIGVYKVAGLMKEFHGLALPAHAGRPSFSLLSNLGFWDEALGFGGVEHTTGMEHLRAELEGLPCLINSDAHQLAKISDPADTLTVEARTAAAAFDALSRRFDTLKRGK